MEVLELIMVEQLEVLVQEVVEDLVGLLWLLMVSVLEEVEELILLNLMMIEIEEKRIPV